jgi:CO/xanthine dehydrogenase FAD-binding subunit
LIGHLPIRTRGTIGGSLVHADPAAEYPVVMVALDAEFTLARRGGTRRVAAADFFETYLTTTIGPDEVLTEIRLPGLSPKAAVAFLEISRRHGDFAIVAAAAVVDLEASGQIAQVRIALGGVGPRPVRARAAERLLGGQRPTVALWPRPRLGDARPTRRKTSMLPPSTGEMSAVLPGAPHGGPGKWAWL